MKGSEFHETMLEKRKYSLLIQGEYHIVYLLTFFISSNFCSFNQIMLKLQDIFTIENTHFYVESCIMAATK